jgi:glycosyltransferase involved in cell wall biosynthesis
MEDVQVFENLRHFQAGQSRCAWGLMPGLLWRDSSQNDGPAAPPLAHPSRRTISVVIPVYNRDRSITRCLDSVAAQTYPVTEIIVVDDGSHDRSVDEILRWQERQLVPLRLIRHEQNRGGGAARNTGIRAATSDWIAFLDSDDYWHPTKIEKQVSALVEAKDAALVSTGLHYFGGAAPGYVFTPSVEGNLWEALLGQNVLAGASSFLARKDLLELIGGYNERLPSCQDWDLVLRLSHWGRFIVVREALVEYNNAMGARISCNARNRFHGHWFILKAYTEPSARYYPKALAALYRTIGEILISLGRPRAAVRFFRASLGLHPFSLKALILVLMAKLRLQPKSYASLKRATSFLLGS